MQTRIQKYNINQRTIDNLVQENQKQNDIIISLSLLATNFKNNESMKNASESCRQLVLDHVYTDSYYQSDAICEGIDMFLNLLEKIYEFNSLLMEDENFQIILNRLGVTIDTFKSINQHVQLEDKKGLVQEKKNDKANVLPESEVKIKGVNLDNKTVVNKRSLPYIDSRIPLTDLDFDEKNPNLSTIKNHANISKLVKYQDDFINIGLNIKYYMASTTNPNKDKYELGRGGFGKTHLAQTEQDKKWIAIKVPHDFDASVMLEDTKSEAEKLHKSQNLIFADYSKGILGMKLLEGHSLYDLITNPEIKQNYSTLQLLYIVKNFIIAIADFHRDKNYFIELERLKSLGLDTSSLEQNRGLHRDIKEENARFNPRSLKVKLCDLGLAIDVQTVQKDKKTGQIISLDATDNHVVGTEKFMAPEIDVPYGDVHYGNKSEVYAFGKSVKEIFSDELKEDNDTVNSLKNLVLAMTHDKKVKRPEVSTVVQSLTNMITAEGKTAVVNIVVLSIDDFLKLDEKGKNSFKKAFFKNKMNGVVLERSSKTSNYDYYVACKELNKRHIVSICPYDLEGPKNSILRVAKNHYDQTLCTLNTEVHIYDLLTNKMINQTDLIDDINVIDRTRPFQMFQSPSSTSSVAANVVSTVSHLQQLRNKTLAEKQAYVDMIEKCCSELTWMGESLSKHGITRLMRVEKYKTPKLISRLTPVVSHPKLSIDKKFEKIISFIDNKEADNDHTKQHNDFVIAAQSGSVEKLQTFYSMYRPSENVKVKVHMKHS